MKILKTVPNKHWQISYRNLLSNGKCYRIVADGHSRKSGYVPNGVTLQENVLFEAKIVYLNAWNGGVSGRITFQDTDPNQPFIYPLTQDSVEELFSRIQRGAIAIHPDGFDVTLTWVKKGTEVFAELV